MVCNMLPSPISPSNFRWREWVNKKLFDAIGSPDQPQELTLSGFKCGIGHIVHQPDMQFARLLAVSLSGSQDVAAFFLETLETG